MDRVTRHILLPAVAPAAIVGLYFTPVAVFGCATRGLIAIALVLVSAVAAFVSIAIGMRAQRRNDMSARWWILTAAILTLPLALVVGPLG